MTRLRLLAALVLAALALVIGAGPAPAAPADAITVRRVDTTKLPEVRAAVQVSGRTPDLGAFTVRENGRIVDQVKVVPISQTATSVAVVLVVDTSGSMKPDGKLDAAKAAARRFVQAKGAQDRVALVAFSERPVVVAGFTNDPAPLLSAIDGLQAGGETALWDAVQTAAGLLRTAADSLPSAVVLSDGADTVSAATEAAAVGAVRAAGATVYPVGLAGGRDFDREALGRLADASGGAYAETRDPRQLEGIYTRLQATIQNQYEVRWVTAVKAGPLDIDITAAGLRAHAATTAGAVTRTATAEPIVVARPGGAGLLGGPGGLLAAGLFALGCVALGVGGLVRLQPRRALPDLIAPYAGGAPVDTDAQVSLASVAIVRRAVDATAALAAGGGFLDRLDRKLDQADVKLRAAEGLFFSVALALVFAALGALVDPLLGLVVLVIGGLAPMALLNRRVAQRQKAFTSELPDALHLIASSLRAGHSLGQAIEAVSTEVPDPMGRELRRVIVETQLGRTLDVALADVARRMGSPDFDWAVLAMSIQREVGGNLAELLTTVAETMIARDRLRREVSALTAEGRMSASLLVALPPIVMTFMYVRNPGYLNPLFGTGLGRTLLVGSLLLGTAGFAWMRKIIDVEI